MLKKILLSVLAVVILFLGYVATQPSHYELSRELKINAPAAKIFPYPNNSNLMNSWGPWKEMDPTVQMSTSGPAEGVGACSSWTSTGRMGVGKATITESVANDHVTTMIEYTKPKMTQTSSMSLRADGEGTIARWSVQGEKNFIGKIMCTFVSMDKMVGPMFEKGLNNLKAEAEKS